jgi:hypothetical protein
MDNATLIERHAAPGRIGLCGGSEWINRGIREAQAALTADGSRSPWSHAFLFSERRVDGHWWVLESDLDVVHKQIRLGVQENRADRYHDAEQFPNLAILDFGLDEAQTRKVLGAGLDLLAGLSTYSLRELLGTLLAMHRPSLRSRSNLLSREGSLYCSAMVQHCYAAAGIELLPGVATKNLAPQDIADSPLPHRRHAVIRDVGESSLRRAARRTRKLLITPIQEL